MPKLSPQVDSSGNPSEFPEQAVGGQVQLVWDYVYNEVDLGGQIFSALEAYNGAPNIAAIAGLCRAYERLYHLNATGDYSDKQIENYWRGLSCIELPGLLSDDSISIGQSERVRHHDPAYGTSRAEGLWMAAALCAGDLALRGGLVDPTARRVTLRAGTKAAIQANASRTASGDFIDPNTGQVIPQSGSFDYGHVRGYEWWRTKQIAREEGGQGNSSLNMSIFQVTIKSMIHLQTVAINMRCRDD